MVVKMAFTYPAIHLPSDSIPINSNKSATKSPLRDLVQVIFSKVTSCILFGVTIPIVVPLITICIITYLLWDEGVRREYDENDIIKALRKGQLRRVRSEIERDARKEYDENNIINAIQAGGLSKVRKEIEKDVLKQTSKRGKFGADDFIEKFGMGRLSRMHRETDSGPPKDFLTHSVHRFFSLMQDTEDRPERATGMASVAGAGAVDDDSHSESSDKGSLDVEDSEGGNDPDDEDVSSEDESDSEEGGDSGDDSEDDSDDDSEDDDEILEEENI
jgi:hypothetical protein